MQIHSDDKKRRSFVALLFADGYLRRYTRKILHHSRYNIKLRIQYENRKNPIDAHVYLIGGGTASLASAVYLEKDAGVPAANIHILEKDKVAGGCLDGAGNNDEGYVIRGARMFEEHYHYLWDLLSNIPSLEDSNVSVKDETFEFSDRFVTDVHVRLMKDGKKVEPSSFWAIT